jgi:1,4-alpha-glucan branching enzyme
VHGYALDLPESGVWREILNSDAQAYGGSGVGNLGVVHAGEDGRANMVLPPLGVLWLKHDRQAHLPKQPITERLLLP